jgi:hypothetical protein
MTYRVVWEIDIEADSPREAAEIADAFRRLSTMPCFAVRDPAGNVSEVDLDESDCDCTCQSGRWSVARQFGRH